MNIEALINALPGSVAQGLTWGLLAIGVYISYKILHFSDLTVDGSLCTGGAIAAVSIAAGVSPVLAVLLAVLGGMAAGLVTGLVHTKLGIPAILSGILTQLALYSINMHIMGDKSNVSISRTKHDLLLTSAEIPSAILVGFLLVALVIVFLYWLFGTQIGSAIRATGNNESMSRAQGINTDMTKVLGLVIANGIVGMAGGVLAQYQGNADINMGRGAIVIGLAAVVIGEVALRSRGNFFMRLSATVFGTVAYYSVLAIVIWAGLSTIDMKLFSAATVAVFMSLPYLSKQPFFKKLFVRSNKKGQGHA